MGRRHWYTAPTVGPGNIFTGNRVLAPDAKGSFPNDVASFDLELPCDIKWIVATDTSSGPQFVATTEQSAYLVANSSYVQQLKNPSAPGGGSQPPLVSTYQNGTTSTTTIVELPSSAKISALSHPMPVFDCATETPAGENDGRCRIYVYIDSSGNIILYDLAKGQELQQITNIEALPDARFVMAAANHLDTEGPKDSKLLAVYGGATRYSHCVLGDCLEGSSLLFIQVARLDDDSYSMTLERQINLPSGWVFEGLFPMFIEDGATLVTTVANSSRGAWLRTYDVSSGDVISESPYIGWGWRHMLFYNNFAPIESDPLYSMVDVLTPHVRKTLEFFDVSTGSLMEMQSSKSKYTTHDIGWRYLDTAISGDLNGDGTNEAILLDKNLQSLVSLQLADDTDPREVWSLPLAGKLTSNIAAVSYKNRGKIRGGVALAAASGRTMRVWMSPSPEDPPVPSTSGTIPSLNITSATNTEEPHASDDGLGITDTAKEPYASNDGFAINFSNSEPQDCSAQSKFEAESVSCLATLLLIFLLAIH